MNICNVLQSYGQMLTETGGSHAEALFPWNSDCKGTKRFSFQLPTWVLRVGTTV
ncbi:MAG: hypothetical protein IK144_05940 [Bacteroidaceae bacterium]|nr:hypothetical protein [Bacteroidaceae bacterium]